jgi:hypothetical protein
VCLENSKERQLRQKQRSVFRELKGLSKACRDREVYLENSKERQLTL